MKSLIATILAGLFLSVVVGFGSTATATTPINEPCYAQVIDQPERTEQKLISDAVPAVPAVAATYELEYQFVHKNGKIKWNANPNWNAESNPNSVGWKATGVTRNGRELTPAVPEVPAKEAVYETVTIPATYKDVQVPCPDTDPEPTPPVVTPEPTPTPPVVTPEPPVKPDEPFNFEERTEVTLNCLDRVEVTEWQVRDEIFTYDEKTNTWVSEGFTDWETYDFRMVDATDEQCPEKPVTTPSTPVDNPEVPKATSSPSEPSESLVALPDTGAGKVLIPGVLALVLIGGGIYLLRRR